MKKIIHIPTKIREGQKEKCDFCLEIPNKYNSTWQLNTRNIQSNKLIDFNYLCDGCKVKFDNKEIEKCNNCEKLQARWYKDMVCSCFSESYKEEHEMVEPERYSTQLEKQLHELSLEKEQLKEDVEIAISALTPAENWGKTKEERSRRLSDENKKLKEKVLGLETELETYKTENSGLKDEVHNLKTEILGLETKIEKFEGTNNQIEQPLK